MRTSIIPIFFASLFLFGCVFDGGGEDNLYRYKGITMAQGTIPQECEGLTDCGLFSCAVDSCFCNELSENGGVLFEANSYIYDDEDAVNLVTYYNKINSISQGSGNIRSVKLNSLFYNVFYNDFDGNERVLTVAIDGTILETVCGV